MYLCDTHKHTRVNKRKSMDFYDETHMNGQFAFGWSEKKNRIVLEQTIHRLVALSLRIFFFVNTLILFITSFWAISRKFSISKQLMLVQSHNALWTWNSFLYFALFTLQSVYFFVWIFSLPFFCSKLEMKFLLP